MANTFVLILITLWFHYGYTTKHPPSINMYQYCDKIVSMMDSATKSLVIYYEHDSGILDRFFKFECTLQISGWLENDIALQFTSFDMGSTKTTVELRQGQSWKTGVPIEGLSKPFSTFNRLSHVFYTHWWRLFIRVKGKAPPDGTRIFTMAMNVFHGGPCLSGEYKCGNGRCIDEGLKCNRYNPCGDLSDCQGGLEIQKIGIIICITIATVLLLSFVGCKTVTYLCNRSKKRQNTDHDIRDHEDMIATSTDTGGISVTYNITGNNTSVTQGPTNQNTALLSGHVSIFPDEEDDTGENSTIEQPPSYHSVISSDADLSDLSDYESDISESETPHEPPDSDNPPAPPDYRTAVGETDSTERRRIRRPRRPARRHSSRYLPRYSEVLRHKDAYEVRGNDESVS